MTKKTISKNVDIKYDYGSEVAVAEMDNDFMGIKSNDEFAFAESDLLECKSKDV